MGPVHKFPVGKDKNAHYKVVTMPIQTTLQCPSKPPYNGHCHHEGKPIQYFITRNSHPDEPIFPIPSVPSITPTNPVLTST